MAGDVLSGNMAMQMAEKEGIKIRTSHPRGYRPRAKAPAEESADLVAAVPLYQR